MISFILHLSGASNSGNEKLINSQSEFDNLSIQTGDSIILDGVFYGSKNIDKDNVSISGGTLIGSQEISEFNDLGAGIYSKSMIEIKWLYITGQDPQYAYEERTISSIPNNNQLTLNSVPANIVGSKLVCFVRSFAMSFEYEVISADGNTVTLDRNHTEDWYSFQIGKIVRLYGLHSYISNDFEWAYESGELRLKLPLNPANYTIKAVYQDNGFVITGNNCQISNVTIKDFYKSAIGNYTAISGLNISNVNIQNCRQDGIHILGRTNLTTINGCTVSDCGVSGIFFNNSTNHIISNNQIYDIGLQNTVGWIKSKYRVQSPVGLGFGEINGDDLSNYATNWQVSNNLVYNCAYNGIHANAARIGTVKRNIVHNCVERFSDGGGIYLFFYRNAYPVVGDQIRVTENFVHTISGSEACIYLDNRIKGCEVDLNTVYSSITARGIMCNADTEASNVHDNIVVNCLSGLWFRNWAAPSKQLLNDKNQINNNIICVNVATNKPLEFSDSVNPYANGGSGDNNYYINPYGTVVLNNGSDKTLAQLQSTYSQDANSIERTNYITAPGDPGNEILLITNPTDSEISGSAPVGSWYDVDSNLVTNYTVNAWSSLLLLKDLI